MIRFGTVVLIAALLAACLGAPPATAVPTAPPTSPPTPSVLALPSPSGGEVTPLFPSETALQPSPVPTKELPAPSPSPLPSAKATLAVPAALTPTALSPVVLSPTATESALSSPTQPAPTDTQTVEGAYPPPGSGGANQPSQTPSGLEAYPPPGSTPTLGPTAYPGPEGATPTRPATATPTEQVIPTATQVFIQATESPAASVSPTPSAAAPALTLTPTEFLPAPRLTGVPRPGGTITIWHSWDEYQVKSLMQIIQAYQVVYPDVRFDLLYVPQDDLLGKYEAAAYSGGGPTLLFGPAEWGGYLYGRKLVEDLGQYASERFLATINPAALGTGQDQGALVSLPYSMRGMVLYRNTTLVPAPSATFAELIRSAQAVKQNGVVGAFLDQGILFTLGHLAGLGGQILDDRGQPVFNQDGYQKSQDWLKLLQSFQQAGPVELNGSRHTKLFKDGRVGLTVEGTWSRDEFAKAIGAENLAIDPWPSYGNGHLSGFVWAESMYMSINTAEISSDDHLAGLRFMGYLMTAEVQAFLGELGFIPTIIDAKPSQEWVGQAMQAMAGGTSFPPALQGEVRTAYLDILQSALYNVFTQNMDPLQSLQSAYQSIQARLAEIQP